MAIATIAAVAAAAIVSASARAMETVTAAFIWPQTPLAMSVMVRRAVISALMTNKMTSVTVTAMATPVSRRRPVSPNS